MPHFLKEILFKENVSLFIGLCQTCFIQSVTEMIMLKEWRDISCPADRYASCYQWNRCRLAPAIKEEKNHTFWQAHSKPNETNHVNRFVTIWFAIYYATQHTF